MHIPPTDKKNNPTKMCAVYCSRGVRREAEWQCKKCSVPLQLEECFEIFHTQQSYSACGTGESMLFLSSMQNFRKKYSFVDFIRIFKHYCFPNPIHWGFKSDFLVISVGIKYGISELSK
jgi:hypothetical protein